MSVELANIISSTIKEIQERYGSDTMSCSIEHIAIVICDKHKLEMSYVKGFIRDNLNILYTSTDDISRWMRISVK